LFLVICLLVIIYFVFELLAGKDTKKYLNKRSDISPFYYRFACRLVSVVYSVFDIILVVF